MVQAWAVGRPEDGRHRRLGPPSVPGPPRVDPPQRTFEDVLNNPTLRALLIVGAVLVVEGIWIAVTGFNDTTPFWVAGCAVAGGLLVASVLLNFVHPGLKDPRWSTTPTRRAARFALSHLWWALPAAFVLSVWIFSP